MFHEKKQKAENRDIWGSLPQFFMKLVLVANVD